MYSDIAIWLCEWRCCLYRCIMSGFFVVIFEMFLVPWGCTSLLWIPWVELRFLEDNYRGLCIRLVSELEDLECVGRVPREAIHTRTLKNLYFFCWWFLVVGAYPSCCTWRLGCMGRQEKVYHNHSPMEIKLGRRCMAQRRWGIFQDLLLGKMNGQGPWIGLVDCQETRERGKEEDS